MHRILYIISFIFLFPFLGWTNATSSSLVNLVVFATDQGSGMGPESQMRFSNDGLNWSQPELFNEIKSHWDLAAFGGDNNDGLKTVYVELKDSAGNWATDSIVTSITLDQTAPVVSLTPSGGDYIDTQTVTLRASETCKIYYTMDGSIPTKLSPEYVAPIILTENTTLKVLAEDMAGNQGSIISETYYKIEDTDGDGMPDWWEIKHGLDFLTDNASQDNDMDGYTNLEEYERGCDPIEPSKDIFVDASVNSDSEIRPFKNIQTAIDTAGCGDTIWVASGTYIENINFNGKVIIIVGSGPDTIIDGGGINSVVTFNSGENKYSVLDGFVIQNGAATYGSGINCSADSSPLIINCTIIGNLADIHGGGIYCKEGSSPLIINSTISDNEATSEGGAIACTGFTSMPVVTNSIFWGNKASGGFKEIYADGCSIAITYSNIDGGFSGEGNINVDPLFVYSCTDQPADTCVGDYHLQSGSACIYAGTSDDITISALPKDDIDGERRPIGHGYDMGSDEVSCPDTDNDGYYAEVECGSEVDCNDIDLGIFPGNLETCDGLDNNCDGEVDENCTLGDINVDGYINIDDYFCFFRYTMGRSSCLDDVDVSSAPFCDVNGDELINIDDIFCLFKNVMGRPSCLDGDQ